MDDPVAARRSFVTAQIAGLAPLDFIVVGVPEPPFDAVQVRREQAGPLVVEVGGRDASTPFTDAQRAALGTIGFTEGDGAWTGATAADAAAATELVERVLVEVAGVATSTPVDVRHGSVRAERVAEQKLAEMRERVEPVLAALLGKPAPKDEDGDYLVDLGPSRVFVAPRAAAGRPPIVRVFAITNAGVTMAPELGMFLARLNFSLMFGRFSLDADHHAVWFDQTLLGDQLTDDELRFMVEMVAETAMEWDQRIAQMFGGTTRDAQSAESTPAPNKPGQGGYL